MIATTTVVGDGLTPVGAYGALRQAAAGGPSFLLESVVGGERWGRFSILGYRPRYQLALHADGRWSTFGSEGVTPPAIPSTGGDPLAQLGAFLRALPGASSGPSSNEGTAARFARSLVGFVGWEAVHHVEHVAPPVNDGPPLARLLGGCTIVVFDSLAQTVTVAAETDDDVTRALADLRENPNLTSLPLPHRGRLPGRVDVDADDATYGARVKRAQEYIAAGDAFQVVLSRVFTTPAEGRDAFDVYRALRVLNPSPYMYFLDLPPLPGESSPTQIAGASPETLVRVDGGTVTGRPLAGTRPRGVTEEEDRALEAELLADPKERAEHVMLIDLGRNDVGRVARVGTVDLVRRMEVERYSHVMHIVSEVRGRVAEAASAADVLRAAFPAGTLSGAPKVRAMQIIHELEGRPRGIYGGAIGYLAPSGDLDFAIAIRTAVKRDGLFRVTAGAGIVEASDPQAEAEETRNKARAVLCAIEAAPRRTP